MVHLETVGIFVGISCRDRGGGRWSVQSIDLDSGRIYNKYRLVGPPDADTRRKLKELSEVSAAVGGSEIVFVPDPFVDELPFNELSVDIQAPIPHDRVTNEQWIDQVVDDMLSNDMMLDHNEHHLSALQTAYKTNTDPPPMSQQSFSQKSFSSKSSSSHSYSSHSYSPPTPQSNAMPYCP